MSLTSGDTAHLLIAITALLVVAHGGGQLFKKLRQPQVIGEILGGLLLGPTVLGLVAPGARAWLLPTHGPVAGCLGAFSSLGMLLMLYLAGTQLRHPVPAGQRRSITLIATVGLALPFAIGLGVAGFAPLRSLRGPDGTVPSLTLVLGMAIAVTSVPVIARIMLDLGILDSVFSRTVLAVAVIEDVVLYVMLAVILGLAQVHSAASYGLWSLIGSDSTGWKAAYFAVVPVLFLFALRVAGPALVARATASRLNPVSARSPLAFRLVLVFLAGAACAGLGIDPLFGALAAGMCAPEDVAPPARERPVPPDGVSPAAPEAPSALRDVAVGFFVPVYFAMVGVQLDVAHHFDALFFLWFLLIACAAKSASVWLGARLAGETQSTAVHLAITMNARGGPGIVLASVTYGAGIINQEFFTALVLLSVVTSQMAGLWLGRAVERGTPLYTAVTPDGPRENLHDLEKTGM